MNYKVCVLGSGAFGSAMAHCAINNQYINRVVIYARDANIVDAINTTHKSPKFLPDYQLDNRITATTNLTEALNDANYVLSCIPVQPLTRFIRENKSYFNPNVPFVSCSKGIILESGKLISEMIHEEFGGKMKYCALSGPSFAKELIQQYPTTLVAASSHGQTAKLIQQGLANKFLKIYTNDDVVGVELAGALKNITAIGAGVIEGAGFGYNTQTAFITRSVGEMQKYARLYGASKHTFYGLAGIGDLMLTSFGSLSRNRTFGFKIGQGVPIEEILKQSAGVVEGLPTLELVYNKAIEQNLNMPLTIILHDFIKGKISRNDCLVRIMSASASEEFPPTFEDLL